MHFIIEELAVTQMSKFNRRASKTIYRKWKKKSGKFYGVTFKNSINCIINDKLYGA